MTELRQHISQINCANCGAAVDIERDAICGFCRTPVAIVDPDQVRKVLEQQRQAEQAAEMGGAGPSDGTGVAPSEVEGRQAEGRPVRQAQRRPDPTLPLTLALERLRAERAWAVTPAASRQPAVLDLFFGNATDPIAGGLRVLSRLLGG
jgi:hypothetical protein